MTGTEMFLFCVLFILTWPIRGRAANHFDRNHAHFHCVRTQIIVKCVAFYLCKWDERTKCERKILRERRREARGHLSMVNEDYNAQKKRIEKRIGAKQEKKWEKKATTKKWGYLKRKISNSVVCDAVLSDQNRKQRVTPYCK